MIKLKKTEKKLSICKVCDGAGQVDEVTCSECKGKGVK